MKVFCLGFGLTINMEGLSLETADIRFMCLFFSKHSIS
ncbi:Uncharacterised protein [Legionella pneumophila]|nr:Uncharacterised protein [Legionella pneumophila]